MQSKGRKTTINRVGRAAALVQAPGPSSAPRSAQSQWAQRGRVGRAAGDAAETAAVASEAAVFDHGDRTTEDDSKRERDH
jgi:hypothetical protein